jgi:hypothetical protein
LFSKDLSNAVIQLGIALIFDPFNQETAWSDRSTFQKAWMITHLVILFGLFGWLISGGSL